MAVFSEAVRRSHFVFCFLTFRAFCMPKKITKTPENNKSIIGFLEEQGCRKQGKKWAEIRSEESLKGLFVFHEGEFLDIFSKAYSNENRSKGKSRKFSSPSLSGGNASVRLRELSMRDPTHKQSPRQSPCQSVSQSVSKSTIQPTTRSSTYPASHSPLIPTPPLTDAWQSRGSGPLHHPYAVGRSGLFDCVSLSMKPTLILFDFFHPVHRKDCCSRDSIKLNPMRIKGKIFMTC